ANFNTTNRLDAVGFAGETNTLFLDGTGLQPSAGVTTNLQHVFMRKLTSGMPQSTHNNLADFVFVDTTAAASGGAQSTLGSPNAQNFSSFEIRTGVVASSLYNPAQ